MKRVSPLYETDSEEGLDENVRQYLNENYAAKLINTNRKNPKLLVVFSGGNAVGKSTISRLIQKQLGGLVLENDEMKRHILKFLPNIKKRDLNRLTWQYSMYLYRHLNEFSTNGLVVRDGVIDWYYDRILPLFSEMGYGLFIIGFDLSEAKSRELITQRGDTAVAKVERFYELMEHHAIHTEHFRSKYKPHILLDDDTVFDHDIVIKKLQQRIQKLEDSNFST